MNSKVKISIFSLAIVAITISTTWANVKLNGMFTDNAVLQQKISIPVWGWANPGEKITVELNGNKASAVAKDGTWMVHLKPMNAGGPYKMTVLGENTIVLNNILIGEVWLCSGQSNMGFPLNAEANGASAIANSKDPLLRLCWVKYGMSDKPEKDVSCFWLPSGPEKSGDFSAVGYYFGAAQRKVLGVPVGIILCSSGGTGIEAWTELDNLRTVFGDKYIQSHSRGVPTEPGIVKSLSVFYNSMIAPLVPYGIKGAVWYQGESNNENSNEYRNLLPVLIKSWRDVWKQGNFPFLIVQLPGVSKHVPEPQESSWAEIREAQLLTCLTVPKTGLVVTIDQGEEDIHPRKKSIVGERIALSAQKFAYGWNIIHCGPIIKSMQVKGNRAVISFRNIGSGLVAKDGVLTDFTIAGQDKKFVNAQAQINGDTVEVWSVEVKAPAIVRYGWSHFPVVNLYNKEGFPASPFSTEDFPVVK